jgi:hypothetical protein
MVLYQRVETMTKACQIAEQIRDAIMGGEFGAEAACLPSGTLPGSLSLQADLASTEHHCQEGAH